jgi:hypothetical protein
MNHLTVENYWTLAAFAIVCALLTLAGFFSRLRRDRIFADTPLVKIRSAAQGYVRLEGHAAPPPGETMTAPLSGRTCVWWDYRVEVKETNSKGESSYRTVDQATSVTPFVLTDTDAECLVGPIGAEVTPTSSQTWSGDGVRPTVLSTLQSTSFTVSNRGYRYHERLITSGTQLTVLGDLRSHTEFGAADQRTREILAQWKGDQPTLLAKFDRNHDGKIDPQEWEAARAAAHTEAEATVLHSPIERVGVVGQTTHGQPFVIAPLDGKNLVRREKQYAMAYLAASVLCMGLCLWSLGKAQHLKRAQNIQAIDQTSE